MPFIELCPVCGTSMLPAPDSWGVYVCPASHGLQSGEYQCQAVAFTQAVEWNARPRAYYRQLIREMGVCGPIGWVPQASQEGDGRLGWGPGKKGGGSKSKRKRKKPKTGGKKFVDSPWGDEGGTHRK